MQRGEGTGGGNIEHIFGGIPEGLLDPAHSAEENLANLMVVFSRFGISIGSETRIANSSQKGLIAMVNSIVSPPPPLDAKTGEELGELSAEFSPDFEEQLNIVREVGRTRNFSVRIGERVLIGENFQVEPQIAIGDDTVIGNGVKLNIGVNIGKSCDIGDFGFLGPFARLGDSVIVRPRAVVPPSEAVPSRSIVEHDEETGRTRITPRIREA